MSEIVVLNDLELRKLQLIELEMLIEVDRICKKNGIKYSITSGTLLGAVRHKGFIPWDDDLDIMFTHNEYEKFFEACKKDLDDTRFFLQDYRTDSGYRWGYAKIRRLNTEYIKKGQEHLKQKTGVCIDIFDLYNYPDGNNERKKYNKKMYKIRKILYSAMGRKTENSLFKRIWYSMVYLIVPAKYAHRKRNKLNNKYESIKTNNVICPTYPTPNAPHGFPSNLFDEYVELEFEGMTFMAIKDYDYVLKTLYNNYMELPPIDKRIGVMNAIKYELIDLNYNFLLEKYKRENG